MKKSGEPLKVLIVDDDPTFLSGILMSLMRVEGIRILTAMTGSDAVREVRAEHPDIVLMDICLPDVNGYEVCRCVEEALGTDHARVWFITGRTSSIDREMIDRIPNACGVLTKPFGLKDVRALLEEATGVEISTMY